MQWPLWAALALGMVAATALRAQTGTLGTAFPLYEAPRVGAVVSLDANGNQTVLSGTGGNPFFGGLAIDAAGNLYVSSFSGGDIVKIDPGGNQTVFSPNSNTSNNLLVFGPTGLAFDTSGNLYVAVFQGGGGFEGSVVKIDPNGNQTLFSSNNSQQGNHFSFPGALAFDVAGNLYVANSFPGNIIKLDASGNQTVFSFVSRPQALAFDASGNLYVANETSQFGGGSIIKIDPNGNQSVVPTSGLSDPDALAFDASGNLYVGNPGGSNIIKIDPGGNQTVFSPPAGSNTNNLFTPGGLAFSRFVPFASSSAKLKITAGPPSTFDLNESFTLATNSNGINPVTENVTLAIGTFSVTIPPGSFQQIPKGRFAFAGTINGVSLQVQIAPLGNNSFTFKAVGTGANLSGLTNPVTVVLTIGNDSGATTTTAQFQ
jgi:sugar lactone lactonase YvrE